MDADVVLSIGMGGAHELMRAFEAAGFVAVLSRGGEDDPIPGLLRLNDRHENRVDLLLGLRGLEPQAFSRSVDVKFQGSTLKFIGREDFIAMKAFAGGALDLIDASRAITAAGPSLDLKLVRRVSRKFGPEALQSLERLLAG